MGSGKNQTEFGNYELTIPLPATVVSRIREEKKSFLHSPGSDNEIKELCIARFTARESALETIIRWIQRVMQKHTTFDLVINNYTYVPQREICLRFQEVNLLAKLLDDLNVINVFSDHEPAKFVCCYPALIPVYSCQDETTFRQAMFHFSPRTFYDQITVDQIRLSSVNKDDGQTAKLISLFMLKHGLKAIAS